MADVGRAEDGFTLIEMLVVIIVLGILAAVVTLSVTGLSSRGESSAQAADEETLRHAEESYRAKSTSASKYATEAELLSVRMIATESSLHDICLNPSKKKYVIVTAGTNCSTVSFTPDVP